MVAGWGSGRASRSRLGCPRRGGWGDPSAEDTGEPPGAGAEEAQNRGHYQAPDDDGVEEYGDSHGEACLREHAVGQECEGAEDGEHDCRYVTGTAVRCDGGLVHSL